jgi:GntR family transcriptional repressor for pyruvate dehydrogenase complex
MDDSLPRIGSKERHSEQIYWAMVDWLAKIDAHPGMRLPNENELADRFGVSRPTMREALRVLEYSGLVESRQGRHGGLFAGQGAVPQVIGALRTLFIIGNRSRENLYEARAIIEVGVARVAATRINDEQLAILANAIDELERDDSMETVKRTNSTFHMTIADSVCNNIMRAIMVALISLLNEMAPDTSGDPERQRHRLEGHRAIYEALLHHDPDGAAAAMSAHLNQMTVSPAPTEALNASTAV